MKHTVTSRVWRNVVTATYFLGFWSSCTVLLAEDGPKPEPIWVMSWAMFIFFIAITIFFFSHSLKRAESLLNAEERKQIEDEMVQRVAERKKAARKAELKKNS